MTDTYEKSWRRRFLTVVAAVVVGGAAWHLLVPLFPLLLVLVTLIAIYVVIFRRF